MHGLRPVCLGNGVLVGTTRILLVTRARENQPTELGTSRRRLVLETLKHLLDLRTTPDDRFAVPRELDAEVAADGIDEFFAVFLARSRANLEPLPGSLRLAATDADRSWRITCDWQIDNGERADAHIEAKAGTLLLLLWERADALDERDRFTVRGEESVVQALMSSPIHR